MLNKRVIFHIDVNSAFLSWEAVYRLSHGETIDLREIPSAVGGDPETRHGIILAKSIPAKKCNVKTGETLFSAKSKCPNIVIVPPRFNFYSQCSEAMFEILNNYFSCIEQYSIDECFIDCTNIKNPIKTANEIKDNIYKNLGFTINIGISSNKLLAKMASDFKKPNRVHTLFENEIKEKMWSLDIDKLFMVGSRTASKLRSKGITTIGDLAKCDVGLIKYYFKKHGLLIWNYANGIDNTPVKSDNSPIKGLGNSLTTPFDVKDVDTAHTYILSLCETVGMRLRRHNYYAREISLSIKSNNFITQSHQTKLNYASDCTYDIYITACKLFNEMWVGKPIRYFSIRVSSLCSNEFYQMSMFDNGDREKRKKLDRSVDNIRLKYGFNSIQRAVFLNSKKSIDKVK